MKVKAVYFNNGVGGDINWQIKRSYSPCVRGKLAEILDIPDEVYTQDDLGAPALSQAEIILSTWGIPVLSEDEIARHLPNLKIIFYAAGSVQNFARQYFANGVRIVSAWAANAVSVAEFTLAQIILANKGYFLSSYLFKEQGIEKAHDHSLWSHNGTFDTKVGIIGAGMIGRKVIELAKACGLRADFFVYDPFLSDKDAERHGVVKCPLENIFTQCQTISNHVADNEQTKGMLHYGLFNRMLPNAAFINTGRGAQVIEKDLARALTEYPGRIALLDVTYPEPPESGHVFYKMPNVFLSGHISGTIGREIYRMGELILSELDLFMHNKPMNYEVTEEMLATMA